MKTETPLIIWKRLFIFCLFLILVFWNFDRILYRSRLKEEKSKVTLLAFQRHKVISNELYTVFHSVQDDFNFFQKMILTIMRFNPKSAEYKYDLKSQLDFLDTHPGYFKVRLTNENGTELFKIVQNLDHSGYAQSHELFDLSVQPFYQELTKAQGKEFYFSSMDANIINGVLELPIRPTVRVSKRVKINDKETGLLIFNIDGQRIIRPFSDYGHSQNKLDEVALLDGQGWFVASSPRMNDEDYTVKKVSLKEQAPELFKMLNQQSKSQGQFETQSELVVYSHFHLPNTTERWFFLSRIPFASIREAISKERMTWLFWELLGMVLFLTWFWKSENKRHEDSVVKVLLKERSEFIQNVSHQLKTPLAIMINSLEKKNPDEQDVVELKKEMFYLSKVVEDMLLLAQVEATKGIPLKNEDILELVNDAVDMTGHKAIERKVQIRFNVDEKLLSANHPLEKPVMGELLKSAIVNIIDNAIDFSPVDGVVDVFVATQEGKVVIRIKDNGPGISDEMLPKLFERFSRSVTTKRKGTGLGLAIARKIVELHGGEIALVERKNGAVFEIRLK